jgi:hypothetical protein
MFLWLSGLIIGHVHAAHAHNARAHTYERTHARTHARTRAHKYILTQRTQHARARTHERTFARMRAHKHARARAHTHTHTYTHTGDDWCAAQAAGCNQTPADASSFMIEFISRATVSQQLPG